MPEATINPVDVLCENFSAARALREAGITLTQQQHAELGALKALCDDVLAYYLIETTYINHRIEHNGGNVV